MTNKPLISVVLPSYNGEEFLKQSIESVINQTYSNWELIIVNDCSTDKTLEIASGYAKKDDRIRVIANDVNKKLPASLNIGFRQARGEYFTWTSDDNYFYPQAFEKMVNFLEEKQEYGMVYARCKLLNCLPKQIDVWGEIEATPQNLLDFNVCGACFLYRKAIADEVGNYSEDKFLAEDHDYWLRVRLKTPIANIDEELYSYRLHNKSLTSEYKNKARMLGVDLSIEYLDEYCKNFPELQKCISDNILLRKAVRQGDEELYKELRNKLTKKNIYKELKQLFILEKNVEILRKIASLGGIYIIRAVKLKLRKCKCHL